METLDPTTISASATASLLARLEDGAPALLEELIRTLPGTDGGASKPVETPAQRKGVNGDDLESLYGLGFGLFEQGEWRDALTVFVHLLAHRPFDVRFQFAAGMCFAQLANPMGAALAFSQALMLEPQRADIAFRLGESLAEAGLRDQAAPVLETALELINGDFDRYHHLQAPTQARLRSVCAMAVDA